MSKPIEILSRTPVTVSQAERIIRPRAPVRSASLLEQRGFELPVPSD